MKKTIYALLFSAAFLFAIPFPSAATVLPGNEPEPAAIKNAVTAFRSLSKKERKQRVKEAKFQLKQLKKEKRAGNMKRVDMAVLIILSILLPPLAVYLHQDEINSKFWISVLLTLLFWLPGVIYALLVVTDSV
jgi:uncharacterized membrane protein YqaE (UPF0057 family)